jgi:hypothetical protein
VAVTVAVVVVIDIEMMEEVLGLDPKAEVVATAVAAVIGLLVVASVLVIVAPVVSVTQSSQLMIQGMT